MGGVQCTFCHACATKLKFVCPNCGGDLVRRPDLSAIAWRRLIRPAAKLVKNPASTKRVHRDQPCFSKI